MAVWRRLSSPFSSGKTESFPSIVSFRSFAATASAKPAAPADKPAGRKIPFGVTIPRPLSPVMQRFLGTTSELPRTEVVKKIWEYIKTHNLQDPADKRVVVCDAKLRSIFGGNERVQFLQITGLITPHILKK